MIPRTVVPISKVRQYPPIPVFPPPPTLPGSGTPRPKTISARDSSAQTFRPIFQSGTARPTLMGPLGPFFYFYYFFFFWGGGWGRGGGWQFFFILFMCIKTRFTKLLFNVILTFRQGNREIT